VFLNVTSDLNEDVIHSVGMPVGNTPKCSCIVSLGTTDLIGSSSEVWLSQKLHSAYGVSLN
jgi:hypothetical protein